MVAFHLHPDVGSNHSLGTCAAWDSNPQPIDHRWMLQPTEPPQPGLESTFFLPGRLWGEVRDRSQPPALPGRCPVPLGTTLPAGGEEKTALRASPTQTGMCTLTLCSLSPGSSQAFAGTGSPLKLPRPPQPEATPSSKVTSCRGLLSGLHLGGQIVEVTPVLLCPLRSS